MVHFVAEFVFLCGHLVGSAIDIVDDGIDTGPILDLHTYSLEEFGGCTSTQIKHQIERQRQQRFLTTVRRYQTGTLTAIANPPEQGLQYFTIHPDLQRHIDTRILGG